MSKEEIIECSEDKLEKVTGGNHNPRSSKPRCWNGQRVRIEDWNRSHSFDSDICNSCDKFSRYKEQQGHTGWDYREYCEFFDSVVIRDYGEPKDLYGKPPVGQPSYFIY